MIQNKIEEKNNIHYICIDKENYSKKIDYVLDEKNKNDFNEELRNLVEKRIKMTRKKLKEQELRKLIKKRIHITRSIIDLNNTTQ